MKLFNKLKRLMGYSIALTLVMVSADRSAAQGASSAISFNGTSHISLGDSLSKSLANSNFTIEMWVKVRSNASDPVFIGNKNWASGANTGFVWCRYATNTLRFNFRAATRTRKDYNMTLDYTKWNHIAITVNRSGTITGYVNGIQNGTPINIAADSGYTLDAALPLRIGADGNASFPINGDMDELRIWNTVRSETEIRNSMCGKLNGTETGLLSYYKMDETTGNTLSNSAAVSSGYFDGTFTNNPARIASGAAIGDTAVNLYALDFTGQSLGLTSPANGNIQVSNIGNTMNGIHVYKINAAPASTTGIANPGSNNVYYGIYAVNDTVGYDVAYDYAGYPDAITFEGGIDLFRRNNADSTWALWTATKNASANTFTLAGAKRRNEIIVGSFVTSITCNAPSALNAQTITTSSAALSWTGGGSNMWNIAYGTGTFTPGTGGTLISNINTPAYNLTGLQSNTMYQYYVQDTCAAISSASSWTGPYTFTTAIDYSQYGSGYGMNFQGTAANEHVNLGDSLSAALATTDFTIETWIRFNNPSSDPAFIGNKNWDNGQNTGILWCWNGNNNLRFNFKPAGGTRRDYDINVPNSAKWNHIAMVVDRKGNLTAYLNGVQTGTPINIAVDSNKTLDGTLPIRIGQDGTGTYGPKFKGAMDELKIWKKALALDEIRAKMCQKLTGAEADLLAYYRMDEAAGNVLTNNATATAAVFSGTLTNNPQRIISGAAIGDTSIYIYPASWAGTSLALGSNAQGILTVDSVGQSTQGVHIYRSNSVPNFTSGIADIGTTNQFFGVFTSGDLSAAYRMQYNYNNYPNALSNNNHIHVYNRNDNAAGSWIQSAAQNNTSTGIISQQQNLGVRQYLLADFVAAACPAPVSVSVSAIDTGSATLSWTSAAGHHIIEIGLQNFQLGTGTQMVETANTKVLDNLNASTAYEFYIKDSCSTASSSPWSGPFAFSTLNPCPQPFNVIADSITTTSFVVKWEDNGIVTQDFIISWGTQGFGNPAFGIQSNSTEKRFAMTGAAVNTAYDFYIRTNCNSSVSNSGWAGPFTFSTIACDIPMGLTAGNITETTAAISWTATGTPAHSIEFGPQGFTQGTGTVVPGIAANSHTITGLTANTPYSVYVQDSCSDVLGSSAWAGPLDFVTAAPTSINEPGNGGKVYIYPNPAQELLSVRFEGISVKELHIVNALGKQVQQVPVAGKSNIGVPIASLSSGIYYLELVLDNGSRITRKIAVQH